jgi:hypothetical protein
MNVHQHSQGCNRCGGAKARAARTRRIDDHPDAACYLAYVWSCSVCGHLWTDDALEVRNAQAESMARRQAFLTSLERRKAS